MKYHAVCYLSDNSIIFGINKYICLSACDRSSKEFDIVKPLSEDFSLALKRILQKNWINLQQLWSMKCGKKSNVLSVQTAANR